MRHFVIAALMFAGAGLVTLIAATLVQQWALSRHVPHVPPPALPQAVAEQASTKSARRSAAECGSAMFQLGSPYTLRKQQQQ